MLVEKAKDHDYIATKWQKGADLLADWSVV